MSTIDIGGEGGRERRGRGEGPDEEEVEESEGEGWVEGKLWLL